MTDFEARMADALQLLEDVNRQALRAGADQADAILVDGTSLSVTQRLGKLEKLERSEGGDVGLRVMVGKRQAVVSSSERSPDALRELVDRAVAMARVVPEDPDIGLASSDQIARALENVDAMDRTDPEAERLTDLVARTEEAARGVSGISNSEGAEGSWSQAIVAVAATNGFAHAYPTSRVGLSVGVIAGQPDTGMEVDYAYSQAVYLSDLESPEHLGREAGSRAVARLDGKSLATGVRSVILEPRISRTLLSHFLGAINGGSLARGTSFLKDAMGEQVFAPGVSIIDDPLRPRGLRSRPCDAEGLATQRRLLVEDGRIKSWILDLRTARTLGLESTAHASRGTGAPPSPSSTNVWLAPGTQSPDALMRDIDDGLYISDLFGQGVNTLTGDYSRGAAGFRIEKGVLTTPVSGVTVAGTLQDMFARLIPADDLVFRYGIDSPTVRIDGLTIAGE